MSRKKPSSKGIQKIEQVAFAPPAQLPPEIEKSLSQLTSDPKVMNQLMNNMGFQNPNFFGGGNIPLGGAGGFPGGGSIQPIEDSTTMFENLRWYLVSNFRQLLSQAFVEIGLIQTIVVVPVDDGLRGGIMIKSKQLSEEEIHQLQVSVDRDADLETAGWAAKWERLYGGAGILALVGDQDPEEPLDVNAIGLDTDLSFRDVDMWELFWDKQNVEGYDPEIQAQEFEWYNYYAENVHKTRVMRLVGMKAPSFIRPRLRGWGVSVVETLIRSINQYLKATDLGFEVLDEFKVDVYKIKNLVNTLLSPTAANQVKQTVQMLNWQKNYNHAVVIDSEDDFDHKDLSFAGLAEAMDGIRMQVAADMRMPISKLFGTSVSKGFQTDQNDMENYNSMIESEVRGKLKYHILRILELKCKKLFGYIPEDLEIEFKPLRELSAVDQETVKTSKFNRVLQAKSAGLITDEEFRDMCNKGNLFDVQLDTTDVALDAPQLEGDDAEEDTTGAPKDSTDEHGADREYSRKTRNAKFKEEEHPRADDGKFGKGGGAAKGKKSSKESKEKGSPWAGNKEIENIDAEADVIREKIRSASRSEKAEYFKQWEKLNDKSNELKNKEAVSNISKQDLEKISDTHDVSNILFHGSLNTDLTGFKDPIEDAEKIEGTNSGQLRGVGISLSPKASYSEQYTKEQTVGAKTGKLYKVVPEKDSIFDAYEDSGKIKDLAKKLGVEEFLPKNGSLQPNQQIESAFKKAFPDKSKKELYQQLIKIGVKGFALEGDMGKEYLFHDPSGLVIFDEDGKMVTNKNKNSHEFDKRSFLADGGENWMPKQRVEALWQLTHLVEDPKWKQASMRSEAAFGELNKTFVVWMFKKLGGKI